MPELKDTRLAADVHDGAVGGDADLARHVVPDEVRIVGVIWLFEEVRGLLLMVLLLLLVLVRYPMTRDTLLKVKLKSSDL